MNWPFHSRSSAAWADRLLAFALLVSIAWNHRSLAMAGAAGSRSAPTLDELLYDPSATSPLLGLAVFGALAFGRRGRLRAAIGGPPSSWLAGVCAGIGFVLLVWSHAAGAGQLVLPALVLELLGGAAWLGGRRLVAVIAFPLLALVCVFPLPAILLNQLVFPLQLATVWLASALLDLVGRAHLVAGDLILTDGVVFQVIEGCCGLKTMLSLMLAAVAYGELTGRRGFEKLVLVALAPAIGFLANGVRVLVLVLRQIPAESAEHQAYGLGAVALGVLLLALAEIGLSKTVFCREGGRGAAAGRMPTGMARRLAVGLVASLLASACLVLVPPAFAVRSNHRLPNIEELPLELEGREARSLRVDGAFLGSVRFGHVVYRSYEGSGKTPVRVFVGLPDPSLRGASVLSPKTAIPHSGWLDLEHVSRSREAGYEREELAIRYDPNLTGDRSRDADPDGSATSGSPANIRRGAVVLVEHVRLGFAPWERELFRAWLGLDARDSRGTGTPLVLRFEVDVIGDRAGAELSLRHFSDRVVDWVRNAGWIVENTQ